MGKSYYLLQWVLKEISDVSKLLKRGRVTERIKEHIGEIPGATVKIEQFSRISDARSKEKNVIKRNQPKYNKQDK